MNKEQFYNELKRKRAELLFQREFDNELARILAEKKEGTYTKTNFDPEYMKEIDGYQRPKPFTIEHDDKYKSRMWETCLKDCTFYFDNPKGSEKTEMKKKLQFRYDSLFPDYWKAPLDNRRKLVMWACEQKNNYMKEKENENGIEECNYNVLLQKYGPNYDALEEKLGHIKGLLI